MAGKLIGNRIEIDKNASDDALKLWRAVSYVDQVDVAFAHLIRDFNATKPSGSDWSQFETNWGLPAGKGQAVYDRINGIYLLTQDPAQVIRLLLGDIQ